MRRRGRLRLAAGGLALVLAAGLPSQAQGTDSTPSPPTAGRRLPEPGDRPLDVDVLLDSVRVRAALSAAIFYKYSYRQSVTEEVFAEDGALKRRETRVYQVIPSREGTERHLISRDGQPPSPSEVQKQEKRNRALKKRLARMREKSRAAQARREAAAGGGSATPQSKSPAPAPRVVRSLPPAPPPAQAAPAAPPPATAATGPATRALVPAPPPESAGTPASPLPPPAPDLPPCDMDDPEAVLRPPPPGSVTKSRRPPALASAEARRSREKTSDYSLLELLQLTDYTLAGSCLWDGRPVHVLRFEPPESFDPLNPVERVMTAMAGTLLIDARELQVLRAECATVAPIKWGAGMVSLREAHVVLEYAKVGGEIWLPSRDVFEFDSRVLIDRDHRRFTHVFDEFRKATVEIETEWEYREDPAEAGPAVEPAPGDRGSR